MSDVYVEEKKKVQELKDKNAKLQKAWEDAQEAVKELKKLKDEMKGKRKDSINDETYRRLRRGMIIYCWDLGIQRLLDWLIELEVEQCNCAIVLSFLTLETL